MPTSIHKYCNWQYSQILQDKHTDGYSQIPTDSENTVRCLQIPNDTHNSGKYKHWQILTDTQDDQENEVNHQLPERGPHHDLPVVRVCHLARGPHACKPRSRVQFSSWTDFFLTYVFFFCLLCLRDAVFLVTSSYGTLS